MKKIKTLLAILTVLFLTGNVQTVKAQEKINVYVFYGNGCPYCENALEFLSSIESEYADKFNLVQYEVWYDETNANVMTEVAEKLGDEVNGVPYIVIGDQSLNGYSEEYNDQIRTMIDTAYDNQTDALSGISNTGNPEMADGVAIKNDGGSSSNNVLVYFSLAIILIGVAGLLYYAKKSVNQ